jgi:hypothetical protein
MTNYYIFVFIIFACLLHPTQGRPRYDVIVDSPFCESCDTPGSTDDGSIINYMFSKYHLSITPDEAAEALPSEIVVDIPTGKSGESHQTIVSASVAILSSEIFVDISPSKSNESHETIVTTSWRDSSIWSNIVHVSSKYRWSVMTDGEKYGCITIVYITAGILVSMVCGLCDALYWAFAGRKPNIKQAAAFDVESAGEHIASSAGDMLFSQIWNAPRPERVPGKDL